MENVFHIRNPIEQTNSTGFSRLEIPSFKDNPIIPPITLQQIFADDHSFVSTYSAEHIRVLIATGDVIPARSVNAQTIKYADFSWGFRKTAEILRSGDITLVNLESPLMSKCPVTQVGMIFCGNPRHIEGLLFAGIDVASLANNHSGNYGEEGLRETFSLLSSNQILSIGTESAGIRTIRGIRFGFLAYNDIGETPSSLLSAIPAVIEKTVRNAKNNSDIVVVSIHWGEEYVRQPTIRQRTLAHQVIDSGADIVIGNHPHWIQPIEIYSGKIIMYAHGNFIFDQMWSEETKFGVVGKYTFYGKELLDVEYYPVKIEDYGQPYFLTGTNKETVLETLHSASLTLQKMSPY